MQYLALLSMVPAALAAGYGYGSSDASTVTPVAAAQTSGASSSMNGIHVMKVGQNGLTFEPESMTVPVGDTVEFHFWPKAHAVARSSFDKPCQPLNATSFFSGPVQVASGMSPTVFSIKVNDTNPIWLYCSTGSHCQSGMGAVINAPTANATRTISNYKVLAAAAPSNVVPAQVQGGRLGAAQVSGTPSGTSPTASITPTGAASRGAISWGLLGGAGLIAGAIL